MNADAGSEAAGVRRLQIGRVGTGPHAPLRDRQPHPIDASASRAASALLEAVACSPLALAPLPAIQMCGWITRFRQSHAITPPPAAGGRTDGEQEREARASGSERRSARRGAVRRRMLVSTWPGRRLRGHVAPKQCRRQRGALEDGARAKMLETFYHEATGDKLSSVQQKFAKEELAKAERSVN